MNHVSSAAPALIVWKLEWVGYIVCVSRGHSCG